MVLPSGQGVKAVDALVVLRGTLHVAESDRREPVISSITGRQLGDLPNMIQPPLLGVVNAASAVSARTLTCRAPAVPRSCSNAVGVHGRTGAAVPQIAAARAERVRSLDPDVARVEREGIAPFDAVPLEGLREELRHPVAPKRRQFALAFNAGIAYNVRIRCGMDPKPG
jgi:hypothetical protein